jgi:predicted alpha/beta hydrolase family esterase
MSRIKNIFSGYKILSKNNNFINIKELNQFKRNSEGKIRYSVDSGHYQAQSQLADHDILP